VITSRALRIDTNMVHGKLFIVSPSGALIDTSGLNLTYSKLKLRSKDAAADPPLHIELAGKLLYAKIIERRPDVSPRSREGRSPSSSLTGLFTEQDLNDRCSPGRSLCSMSRRLPPANPSQPQRRN
jgi:hypothetical protein